MNKEDKELIIEFVLCLFLGWTGAHKFYRRHIVSGIVYLLTFGVFGFGWLVNIIVLTIQILKMVITKLINNNKVDDREYYTKQFYGQKDTVDASYYTKENTYYSNNKRKILKGVQFTPFNSKNGYALSFAQYNIDIVGEDNRNLNSRFLEVGHPLRFEKEPSNPFNPLAIKVLYDNTHIGYLPPDDMQTMAHQYLHHKDKCVEGMITSIDDSTNQIQIGLAFYEPKVSLDISTKLINTGEEKLDGRQYNLSLLNVNDQVSLQYNEETHRYIVYTNQILELGEIDEETSSRIKQLSKDYDFDTFIKSIKNKSPFIECMIEIKVKQVQ